MRTCQHAAGDVTRLEPILQEDARGVVGALAGAAEDEDLAVAGEFAQAGAQLRQRDVDRARDMLHLQLRRLAHIQEQPVVHGAPVADRHVVAQDIHRDHPGKVDGVLGAAEGRRVGKLRLFQVVDGKARLDRHGKGVDPRGNAVLAEHLRAEETAVGFAEEDFRRDVLGAGIVARVRIRVEVDLLEIRVAKLREDLLADAGLGDHALEDLADRGALRAAETGVAPGDHFGRDAALAVGRPGQRDERPLAGDEILDFDRVAHGEDIRVAGAHLLVDADAAALADLDAGHLRQRRLRPHADRQDHDVRRQPLA